MSGVRWFLLCVCALISGECGAAEQPNILFLLVDDQRPDTIAALGNPHIRTPHLDRLVRSGMTFTRATCSYPICHISRAEILTGRHGWENGMDGLKGRRFRDDVSFWPETLRQSGYDTCYVGKWHTPGRPSGVGFAQVRGLFGGGGGKWWRDGQHDWKGFPITGYRGWVFQSLDGRTKYPERGVGLTPDISARFADAAIGFLNSAPERGRAPWFLHVNFTAPHDPLLMPPGYEGRYLAQEIPVPANFLPEHPFDHGNLRGRDEALLAWPRTHDSVRDLLRVYYSVIENLDAQVGRILSALEKSGQSGNTIVIFASDHGMGCGSHGLRGKQSMYEHTINVPFLVRGPGIPEDRRTDAQIYLRDLYPTTCELAGIPVPDAVTARSFAGVLRGETDAHHRAIYGYYTDAQRMIRTGGWKLVRYPQVDKWQLFNLSADPHELNNLADAPEHRPRFEGLRDQLLTWRRQTGDPVNTP